MTCTGDVVILLHSVDQPPFKCVMEREAQRESDILLLPFLGGDTDLAVLTAAHFIAVVSTMLAMAVLTTYVFKLGILRKMWVDFDTLWRSALVIIGLGAALESFI
jgi:hypothetical protein